MDSVVAAAITGILSLMGVLFSNISSNRKFENKMESSQAVTDCKIEALTSEVRKHNNFAEKIPVIEEQIKMINHRLDKKYERND